MNSEKDDILKLKSTCRRKKEAISAINRNQWINEKLKDFKI